MSSSKSSTAASTSTSTTDNKLAVSDDGFGVSTGGGAANVTIVADEAFQLAEAAIRQGGESLDYGERVSREAFQFGEELARESHDLAGDALDGAFRYGERMAGQSYDLADDSLDFGRSTVDRVFDAATKLADEGLGMARVALTSTQTANRSESSQALDKVLTMGLPIMVIAIALVVIYR